MAGKFGEQHRGIVYCVNRLPSGISQNSEFPHKLHNFLRKIMTNENIFKYLNLPFRIININTFLALMSHSVRNHQLPYRIIEVEQCSD